MKQYIERTGLLQKLTAIALTIGLCVLSIVSSMPAISYAADEESGDTIHFVLTSDMHSHEEKYPKLATVINKARAESDATFVLDGGDFSMGTPYQTIYKEEAPELRLMGVLGYDATTLGNHEFDYRSKGLTTMLNTATSTGEELPEMVIANIDWETTNTDEATKEDGLKLKAALDNYGAKDYTVIEHGGKKIAAFGIFGKESDAYAPESGTVFLDQVETAQATVDKIKAENDDIDMIVCLSHSGFYSKSGEVTNKYALDEEGLFDENFEANEDNQEDIELAEQVEGIDLILSGHAHFYLYKPLKINDTVIAACGQYNDGVVLCSFSDTGDGYELHDYEWKALDESVKDNKEMSERILEYKEKVDEEYFSDYGLEWNQTLVTSDFDFTPIDEFAVTQGEDTLGNIIADAYIYGVEQAEGNDYETVDVAVAPAGIIRGSFQKGPITTADAYNVLSLGTGADMESGYPLVSVYLTGKELKLAAEVDISISPLMQPARLYMSGLEYSYNPHRMILNRTFDVQLGDENGELQELEDDQLYRVTADLYSAQMLGSVNAMSYGILSLVPKDKDGNEIEDYEACIIKDSDGKELKEWYALASYLQSFEDGKVPEKYASTEGRKILDDSWSPAKILKQPNRFFFMIIGVVVVVVIIFLLVIKLIRRIYRKRKDR